jgi:formylglycine-generating enzyme required for sulfatase activity
MKKTIQILAVSLLTSTAIYAQAPASIPEKPEVIAVKGGTFSMGGTGSDEKPVHNVTVSDFSIGKYEVTVGQYKAFCTATGKSMTEAPSWGWNDKHPMVNVNYNDAVSYCNWLGEKYGGDWRLPTEAEWEYAARGGNKNTGYTYAGSDELEKVGWFADNAGGQPQSVGRKKPNELGIFDMSGNVWEWCKDWYSESYYSNSPSQNPKGAASGTARVLRGGSWDDAAAYCRVAFRDRNGPSSRGNRYGFRVVLSQ